MEWNKLESINLKEEIYSGNIVPTGVLDSLVWVKENQLIIEVEELKELVGEVDELLIFLWEYDKKIPLLIKTAEGLEEKLIWNYDKALQYQMNYLGCSSVRLAFGIRIGNKFACGYFRNKTAKQEELLVNDRWICKLVMETNNAIIAYWTEGGILGIKKLGYAQFDELFYRGMLVGTKWEENVLLLFIEVPMLVGEPTIEFEEVVTKEKIADIDTSFQDQGTIGLKRVFRVEVTLSDVEKFKEGTFRVIFSLGNRSFRIFSQDTICDKEIHTVHGNACGKVDVFMACKENGLLLIRFAAQIYQVLLSVVTAVYNTAPFLSEMINSILTQNVDVIEKKINQNPEYWGCKDVYELILVDDGSTDGSAEIIDDFARISNRIKVIHKENGGVSSARNAGIEIAKGKYINFIDSDDKFTVNTFQEVISLFEENYKDIAIITVPMLFFDAATGSHWVNYKYGKENGVIDLKKQPDFVTSNVSSTFIKTSLIGEKRFNSEIKIGEDMLFVNDIIMESGQNVGAVPTSKYMYRKRSVGEASAMDTNKFHDYSYIPVVRDVFKRLLDNAKERYGYVPKFVQHAVMAQLQWRFATSDKGEAGKLALGEEGFQQYKDLCISLLEDIDDDVIMSQRKIWIENHFDLLMKKYNCKPLIIKKDDDIFFEINGISIQTGVSKCYVRLDFLSIKDDTLHIEGFAMNFVSEIELVLKINGDVIEYKVVDRDVNKYSFDYVILHAKTFSADIPLNRNKSINEITFWGKYDGFEVAKKNIRYSKTVPLSSSYSNSYYMKNDWCVRNEGGIIKVYNLQDEFALTQNFEEKYISQVEEEKNANKIKGIIDLRKTAMSRLAMKSNSKKIMLVSDRIMAANDNGEAFFRYLHDTKDVSIEAFFVISDESPDFERMKEFGKVVVYGSNQHKILHLMSDFIVSSAGDEHVINPWFQNADESEVIRDLLARPQYIFLQHGITHNDLSGWLNKYSKNITGFVCSARREADSILDYDYYYDKEQVWLTGFPRHDRLYHNEKRYITIMPTWRKWLADSKWGNRPKEGFIKTEYFQFYNELLNNSRLLEAAEKYNYTVCFMPHPSVQTHIDLFKHNEKVRFFSQEKAYCEIYAESNLVVTDYSSACMDLSLLRKPVVYCQFDKDEFLSNHTLKAGYFDYVKDGFGEVTYDMDSLIDVVIMYMQEECKIHNPYDERIDKFFEFNDYDNCKRVYERIKKLF